MKPHLIHVFPSFGIGGMQLRTVRIMGYLGSCCRHTVISLDGTTAAADQITDGISVEVIPLTLDKRHFLRNLLAFRTRLQNLRPNLLATYNWGAIEWAAINSIWRVAERHIHFEAGFGVEEATRQFRRRVIARRFALRRSEAVVVPSRTLERIASAIWRLPASRIKYIPDGIDIARFSPKRHSAEAPERIILGTLAPLRPEKNVRRLIDAFSQLAEDPRFELVIAGDGPDRAGLEAFAAGRGLRERVRFLGHVARPEDVLPRFDIFGISSDTEQIPNALLEAMAAGLPIASVDVGDIRNIVAHSNRGFVVQGGSENLASAVRELGANASLRRQIGHDNRLWVERHFAQEKMFLAYQKLFFKGDRNDPTTALEQRGSRAGAHF